MSEHPKLRVSSQNEWAPFDYTDRGVPTGFSIDYIEILAKKVGFEVEYVTTDYWDEIMQLAQNKDIDIVHSVNRSPEREETFNFTQPYLVVPQAYFGRVGSKHIETVADLKGLRIGVVDGWSITENMKKDLPDLNYVSVPTAKDAFIAISTGEIDAFADNLPVSEYLISSSFISGVEVVGRGFIAPERNDDLLHLATHKDEPLLLSIIEKGMAAISDEEFSSLTDKWQMNSMRESNLELTDEEQEWLLNHPVLNISNDMNFAPIDYTEDGRAMGFSADYINLIAIKLGVKTNFVNGYSMGELLDLLEEGKLDIAHSLNRTPERAERFEFTAPYLDSVAVYFGKVGADPIVKPEDLDGRRIGYIKGLAQQEIYERDFPHLTMIEMDSTRDALNAISLGEIDVFAEMMPVGQYIINKNFIPGVGIIGSEFFGGEEYNKNFHLVVNKNSSLLLSILKKGMAAVSGFEFQAISEKWIETFDKYQDIGLSEQEKLWLEQHSILKVSNQENWPPIDFVQNNMPAGLSIDYLNLLASKIGVEFYYVNGLSWNALMEQARDGQIDILHSLYQMDNRSEYLNFTRPYLDVPLVYFGRIGSEPIVIPEDLSGRRIGAIKGWAQTEVFRTEFPHLEIIEFETINEAFLQLSAGKVDVVADSLPVAQYIISQNFIPGLEVVGTDFFTQGQSRDLLRIASHKNEPMLSSILQKAMDTVTSEEFKQISDKWQEKYTITDHVDLSYDELRWLADNPIIDVAVDPDAYPFEFVNEAGELDGVSGDVLDLVRRRI